MCAFPPPPPPPPHPHHTNRFYLLTHWSAIHMVLKIRFPKIRTSSKSYRLVMCSNLNIFSKFHLNLWRTFWDILYRSTHTDTHVCVTCTYPMWPFFCSSAVKKNTFFKPTPFPLKIRFGADFFLCLFNWIINSILQQITTYSKMLPLWENWDCLIRENVVWACVSPHNVSRSYIVWTSFVLRST